jgi:hypothetical protein
MTFADLARNGERNVTLVPSFAEAVKPVATTTRPSTTKAD